ncbi:uncharacterized protein LOC121862318 isoform X3 [Homarus americanus]|uniref:uncharacterized protein LOC121862318 isoform X3 n=1 Tax=Homarus americanus TaxID=6706 RepID=UPI001C478DFC|nr:uncharacterized protein LOC121862318 isoform X3 [Homarus americanus]
MLRSVGVCWQGVGRGIYKSEGGVGGVGVRSPSVAAMLYYSVDPQFSALIFSVCGRHERFTLFPDAFACYAHGHPGATDVLAYVHTMGVQLATLGDHYACFLTQVRAGSVIFLVGVGSLVCWKLWEHWRNGADGSSTPPPTPTASPPARRPRGILASLLEEDLVQDPDEYEDEDPAFIQGKYFGPDSPSEEVPCDEGSVLSSDVSEASNSEALAQPYHADASASYSVGDGASSSGEDSLPTDEDSDEELRNGNKRVVKRKHKASELHKNQATPRHCVSKPSAVQVVVVPLSSSGGRQKTEAKRHPSTNLNTTPAMNHPLQDGWLSSESSPVNAVYSLPGQAPQRDLKRLQGDGSETPDSEEMAELRKRQQHVAQLQSGGHDDGADWLHDSRAQPEGEEEHHQSSNISSTSLSDLMEKIRHRGHRGSVSRDNSIASNLSELVTSPLGSKRFPFKREDSVCSNLSDFAPSECSEMSLDVSVREDLACKTFTCLDDIEQEIDDLKSSMLEMDEEVTKFSSRPNPYTFKTTFSDHSVTSGDSRPNSAMGIVNAHRSRANFKGLITAKTNGSSDSEAVEASGGEPSQPTSHGVSGSEAEGSYEWDSPQHGWSSARAPPLSRLPELPSEDNESLPASVQDDLMPSLEWDNGCLRQYAEATTSQEDQLDEVFHPVSCDSFAELGGFEEYKVACRRQQLLPDHSSLELDLEEELMSTTGPVTEAPDLHNAPMTISIDSAIHSGTGSRSTSSSPLPLGLGHSLLSSSGLASSSEISPATPDSETTGWPGWERRIGPGEFGSKARRYWSSEESGFMEGLDAPLDTSLHAHLSPVHEIKEKEGSESSTSTPLRRIDNWNSTVTDENINNTSDNNLNNNLIMGNKASTGNDNDLLSYTSSDLTPTQDTHTAIGPKLELTKYANTEWQGNTPKAQNIKQGYSSIPIELSFTHLRKVRGDNYCGIRAALYQMLSLGLSLPNGHSTHSRLAVELSQGASWLREWSFGHRLNFTKEQILNGFWECLDALDSMVLNLMGCENRECVVLSRLNGDPNLDVKLCEAVKLHMLATALDLYVSNNNGENVPLFAMIMFARHSSLTPRDLLRNHLNPVGDTAGLEQDQHKIEMFLMGHTLGVTLQVVRPASFGKDDFICYYPDANIGVWPEVTLVAEDDRHYNVLVK